jgi:hypothetical protein
LTLFLGIRHLHNQQQGAPVHDIDRRRSFNRNRRIHKSFIPGFNNNEVQDESKGCFERAGEDGETVYVHELPLHGKSKSQREFVEKLSELCNNGSIENYQVLGTTQFQGGPPTKCRLHR